MRQVLAVAALAVVLAVSGCVPKDVIPTLPPTPSATPVFASEEEALAAAEDAYAAYLEMSDLIASEGGINPERIEEVAVGEVLEAARKGFEDLRANSWRTVGATMIVAITPQLIDTTAPSGEPVVIAYICVDVSDVDVLDDAGASVVSPDRPALQAFEVGFEFGSNELMPSTREPWGDLQPCGL